MTVYFRLPDMTRPIGGHFVMYRHVDLLNRARMDAAILHQAPGFRHTWFENSTVVRSEAEVQPDPRSDVVVMPETRGPDVTSWHPAVPKVIFNQNASYSFRRYPLDLDDCRTAYRDEQVLAVLVVSEDSRRYLEYAFPGLRVHRLHVGFDQSLFRFVPLCDKQPAIAWMPRKAGSQAEQVLHMLKHRGALAGFRLAPIDDVPLADVAAEMASALVFMNVTGYEGFGLPPREAMASGCATVGFHGFGGAEDFDPDDTWPVPTGDVVALAQSVEAVLGEWRMAPDVLAARLRRASGRIRSKYSPQREQDDVVSVWRAILERRAPSPAAAP